MGLRKQMKKSYKTARCHMEECATCPLHEIKCFEKLGHGPVLTEEAVLAIDQWLFENKKQKWHKIADGDLPKHGVYVLLKIIFSNGTYGYCTGFYNEVDKNFAMDKTIYHDAFGEPVPIRSTQVGYWRKIPKCDLS